MKFRNTFLALMMLSILGAGASSAVLAQSGTTATQATGTSAREMRASELLGMQVNSAQGEKLGKIEDLVIDITNDKVSYATLSFGGVLGVGDKLFAYPVSAFSTGKDSHELVLNVSKEQLKNAPGFARHKRQDYNAEDFRGIIGHYLFKEDATRRSPQGDRLIGAHELIGKDINDHASHNAGKLADLIVNFGNQRAIAVMRDADSNKLVALPLQAFTFPSRPDLDLMLNIDRNKLANAGGFEKWPDLNSASARQEIDNQLSSLQAQIKPNPAAAQSGGSTSSGSSR